MNVFYYYFVYFVENNLLWHGPYLILIKGIAMLNKIVDLESWTTSSGMCEGLLPARTISYSSWRSNPFEEYNLHDSFSVEIHTVPSTKHFIFYLNATCFDRKRTSSGLCYKTSKTRQNITFQTLQILQNMYYSTTIVLDSISCR